MIFHYDFILYLNVHSRFNQSQTGCCSFTLDHSDVAVALFVYMCRNYPADPITATTALKVENIN